MPQVRGNRARRIREDDERITLEDLFSLFRPLLPPRRVLRELCDHLTRSRIEILKGFRAIIDSRIDQLEGVKQKKKGVERIRIEE